MNTLIKSPDNRLVKWPEFFDFDVFSSPWLRSESRLPALNISEDDKSFEMEIFVPGFKKEDFNIGVSEDVLNISAETRSEKQQNEKQYSHREFSYNSFTRSFRLPGNVKDDAISAQYADGVLKVNIPKSEVKVKASKNIRVT